MFRMVPHSKHPPNPALWLPEGAVLAGSTEPTLGLMLRMLLDPCERLAPGHCHPSGLPVPGNSSAEVWGSTKGRCGGGHGHCELPAFPTEPSSSTGNTWPPSLPYINTSQLCSSPFVQVFSIFRVSAFAESHPPVVWRLRALSTSQKQPLACFPSLPSPGSVRGSTAGNCSCSGQETKVRNVEL